jgi:hypothetical protein
LASAEIPGRFGVEDIEDERLVRLNAQWEDAASQDAIASALDDYAAFAEMHEDGVNGLGGFNIAMIAEARNLAKQLRERSARKLVGVPTGEPVAALDLRNRIATLLMSRMSQIRSIARFVFRHHPQLSRRVTSSYERKRRMASYRARNEAETETASNGASQEVSA